MAQVYKPSTQEAKAGELRSQGQLGLHSKNQATNRPTHQPTKTLTQTTESMAGPARRNAPSFRLPHARWKGKILKAGNTVLMLKCFYFIRREQRKDRRTNIGLPLNLLASQAVVHGSVFWQIVLASLSRLLFSEAQTRPNILMSSSRYQRRGDLHRCDLHQSGPATGVSHATGVSFTLAGLQFSEHG